MVAGEGFELPKGTKSLRSCRATSGLSLRAALRYPEKRSGFRFPPLFRPLRNSRLHFLRHRRREAVSPNEPARRSHKPNIAD